MENQGKTMGKPWENGKTMGEPRFPMGKPEVHPQITYTAIEHSPDEIVSFHMKHGDI